MKTRKFLEIIIFSLFLASCQQNLKILTDDDIHKIRTATEIYSNSMKLNDSFGAASVFADDAIRMQPGRHSILGREAIQKWIASLPEIIDFETSIDEIDGYADLAYIKGDYSITVKLKSEPNPISENGKYVEIFRKQQNGDWKVTILIYNKNH